MTKRKTTKAKPTTAKARYIGHGQIIDCASKMLKQGEVGEFPLTLLEDERPSTQRKFERDIKKPWPPKE